MREKIRHHEGTIAVAGYCDFISIGVTTVGNRVDCGFRVRDDLFQECIVRVIGVADHRHADIV